MHVRLGVLREVYDACVDCSLHTAPSFSCLAAEGGSARCVKLSQSQSDSAPLAGIGWHALMSASSQAHRPGEEFPKDRSRSSREKSSAWATVSTSMTRFCCS